LHIPIALMLIGIVLRGSSFTFRSYDSGDRAAARRWGRVFAVTSVITPVFLGVCVGAIASGALGRIVSTSGVYDQYIAPWFAPLPLACGVFALVLFAFLAAVYLTLEAEDNALREDFRRRALWAAVAMFVAAFGTLWIAHERAPALREALTTTPWAIPLQIATGLSAIVAIGALWTRRWRLARVAAVAQVSCILWGWGAAQYPALIPGRLTIAGAAAPSITLRITLIALGGGSLILIPSLGYLFRVFKSTQTTQRNRGATA
jgi:cytochrome d ubiquinol oxidase subunit II